MFSIPEPPLINEFQLSQFEFGLLSGIGFALFYTLLGIPIANLSEKVSRKLIIGICVILWSLATVLCGFTTGFITLLLARMLVGIGEAGCTPPANSMISDYYAPTARPTALGIYAMGVTAGGVLAQVFGGFILDIFTWREAFIFVGAPGILLGIVFLLTVKEPPRGYSDPVGTPKVERANFSVALAEIFSKRTFWVMTTGATIAAFAGYSLVGLQPQHVVFTHGFATQSISDISASAIAPAILESCLTRIFLANERAQEPALRETYERFGLNMRQIEIIARATPKRDYYFQSPKGSRLFDLGLGPVALAFTTAGTPEDQATIDRVMAETEGEGFAQTWLHEKGLAWAADLLARWPGHPSAERPLSQPFRPQILAAE